MKLKIDENLPADRATLLLEAHFEADTVADENLRGAADEAIAAKVRSEGRVLITLDVDFGNIRAYPLADYAGIIILRPKEQDKQTVLALLQKVILALANRPPTGELWIVEPDRLRFRVGDWESH